jgi:hypothetical protein
VSEKREETLHRAAAILVVIGLVVEGVSLRWTHPTAFLLFTGVGGVFLGAGMIVFLSSLLRR